MLERPSQVETERIAVFGATRAHRARMPCVEHVQVGVGHVAAELFVRVLREAHTDSIAVTEQVALADVGTKLGHAADV